MIPFDELFAKRQEAAANKTRVDLYHDAEKALRDAITVVGKIGKGPQLSAALDQLRKARANVADYIDGIPVKKSMDFGDALRALMNGRRIARKGWQGSHSRGEWLTMSGPLEGRLTNSASFWSGNNMRYAQLNGGGAVVLPAITMKTGDGAIMMGWTPSQADMFATDWEIIV